MTFIFIAYIASHAVTRARVLASVSTCAWRGVRACSSVQGNKSLRASSLDENGRGIRASQSLTFMRSDLGDEVSENKMKKRWNPCGERLAVWWMSPYGDAMVRPTVTFFLVTSLVEI